MQRPSNVGSFELSHQSRRRLMGRWLMSALILAATVSVNLSAWGQSTAQNRGLGKVTPEYVSWYHSRVKTPIYLVDNQGRNAARILIYTWAPPGAPVTQHVVRGDEQFDKEVKLKVIVDNLTTNCKVDVNWLAFLFREDGQPSSAGLDAPPGANPDTSVAAGQSYVHIFNFTEVKTYVNRGTPVLHEVKPELMLQCPGSLNPSSTASSPSGNSKAPKGSSSAAKTRGRNAGEPGERVVQILGAPVSFGYDNSVGTRSEENLRLVGCTLSGVETLNTPGFGAGRNDFTWDLGHTTKIANFTSRPPDASGPGLYVVATLDSDHPKDDQDPSYAYEWYFADNNSRQAFIDAVIDAAKNCGGSPAVYP